MPKSKPPVAAGTPEQRLRACEPPAETINAEHDAALADAASAIGHAIRCGELLIEKKQRMGATRGGDRRSKGRAGSFEAWVSENCDFELTQAKRYMLAARNKDLIESMAVESLRGALAALPSDEPLDDWDLVSESFRTAKNAVDLLCAREGYPDDLLEILALLQGVEIKWNLLRVSYGKKSYERNEADESS